MSAEEGFDGLAFFIDNADQHVHSKDVQDEVITHVYIIATITDVCVCDSGGIAARLQHAYAGKLLGAVESRSAHVDVEVFQGFC